MRKLDDLISRQAAIDAINHICPVDTEYDCTLLDRVDVRCVLSDLPSAQPEASILTVTVNPDSEEIERVAREIKDAPVMVLPSAQPTIEAEPVRRGRWKYVGVNTYDLANGGRAYEPTYLCSLCGMVSESYVRLDEPIMLRDADYPNYCPACGAKMEG